MRVTTFDEFRELARRGTFVPVCKEIVADLLTPCRHFSRSRNTRITRFCSSRSKANGGGRYSFLGKDPFLVLRSRWQDDCRPGGETGSDEPFIDVLRQLMAGLHSPIVPGLPRFTGGAVGYLGYDAAAWFEPVELQPSTSKTKRAS